jgi:hypothetical protein
VEVGDEEFERFSAFMAQEHEKSRRIEGRRLLREARERYGPTEELIDRVRVIPGGKAAAVDKRFAATNTLLPSSFIRTQLRLAMHYIRAADDTVTPMLSSFVVLRASVECTATAHWLMAGDSHRESVSRVLNRMWWDTQSAAEMATAGDGNSDPRALDDLRGRIAAIVHPIKGLDAETITQSTRIRLSDLVKKASRALRPNDPGALFATWMACAAVSHGNIPVSAGAGLAAALIESPSKHPIDEAVYAQLLSVAVADLRTTAGLFERRAVERHAHQRPDTP